VYPSLSRSSRYLLQRISVACRSSVPFITSHVSRATTFYLTLRWCNSLLSPSYISTSSAHIICTYCQYLNIIDLSHSKPHRMYQQQQHYYLYLHLHRSSHYPISRLVDITFHSPPHTHLYVHIASTYNSGIILLDTSTSTRHITLVE